MYLFLFGRDYKLSLIEVLSYFKLNNISYSLVSHSNKFAIFNFDKKISFNKVINDLGGTTRIYKIFYTSDKFNLNFINKFNVNYPKKFNYSISYLNIDPDRIQSIVETFKEQFKLEKVKGVYKKPRKQKDKKINTIINPYNYYSFSLDNGFELFVGKDKDTFYFATTVVCYKPDEIIKKDTLRPEKENLYSTSFRLVKIMINILQLKTGKRLLDPFSGLGNFLIEGLYKGYDVLGIDKDRDMVLKSKKNVLWAKDYFKLKNNFSILHGDSTKLKFNADAVFFEPFMGPFISKLPNLDRANNIAKSLHKLYFDLFKNLNINLKQNTKIVCIFPEFKTYDNKTVNISKDVFLKNNFQLFDFKRLNTSIDIENPIFYSTPNDSKINRYVYVLELKK